MLCFWHMMGPHPVWPKNLGWASASGSVVEKLQSGKYWFLELILGGCMQKRVQFWICCIYIRVYIRRWKWSSLWNGALAEPEAKAQPKCLVQTGCGHIMCQKHNININLPPTYNFERPNTKSCRSSIMNNPTYLYNNVTNWMSWIITTGVPSAHPRPGPLTK